MAPRLTVQIDREVRETEVQNLKAVARGSETYLRSNLVWPPSLAAHSPDYAPFPAPAITLNDRGFPRYYFVHPSTAGLSNAAGLAEPDLTDVRFMTITNLEQDAAPLIITQAHFEAWWTTDEAATPGLHISRGNVAELFRRLTLRAEDPGGSYQIDGVTTNSGGGTLADRTTYHLKGTPIALDDNDPLGSPEITFALAANAEYRYCGATGWQMGATSICTSSGTVLDEFNAIAFNGNDLPDLWTNPWQEGGESDGPTAGRVQVVADTHCAAGNCLRIGDGTGAPKNVTREVDLTGAASATLTFTYRRDVTGSNGEITLAVSATGGGPWTTLQTYALDASDAGQVSQSFDLTPYIGAATTIRFRNSGNSANRLFYADDIQIAWN